MKDIGRKLSVFGFGGLQDLVTLFDILQREGISIEEVKEFIASSLKTHEVNQARYLEVYKAREELWKKNVRKCPVCKMPLGLREITAPKGRRNVNGYSCHWFCAEDDCLFEEYTHDNYKELYKRIMEG